MIVPCIYASAVVRSLPEGSILVAESVMWKIALGLFNDLRNLRNKFQDQYYPQLPGDQSLVAKAGSQNWETIVPMGSTVRKQGETNAATQSASPVLLSLGPYPMEWHHPHCLPSLLNLV